MVAMNELLNSIGNGGRYSTALASLAGRIQTNTYLRGRWFESWADSARRELSIGWFQTIKCFLFNRPRWKARQSVKKILAGKREFRNHVNDLVVDRVVAAHGQYFDSVESKPLTPRQRESCASDEDANLVIAGAGSGKTSTIVAKVGILLKTGQCTPDEILAISFTKKSSAELEERIKDRIGTDVQVSTFHKLGLGILTQSAYGKPLLAAFASDPDEKTKHLNQIIQDLARDKSFCEKFVRFCAFYRIEDKQLWHFDSLAEYVEWIRSNKIISLDGVPKKSFQESVIANWLIQNGVEFKYEHPYEHPTRTMDYRQYCPDFWLPKLGIYIEHYGLDEAGKTAPFIDEKSYKAGIEWKRRTHRQYGTRLVETYSWEHQKGLLLPKLASEIRKAGGELTPIPLDKVFEILNGSGVVSQMSQLASTFLTLYKGNGNRLAKPDASVAFMDNRTRLFIDLFDEVRKEYEKRNADQGVIDFEDMIIKAASLVREGVFRSKYKYILIDEFQDISPGRAELVLALRNSCEDCAIFAVGDDWQSIYRFAGSDIGGMTRFSEIFGYTRQVSLDKTFRFDNRAVDFSGAFILKNKAQIDKKIDAVRQSAEPSHVLYLCQPKERPLEWVLSEISKTASQGASVLVLERYKFHLPDNHEWHGICEAYPELKMERMSIHASKGLEADFVIFGLRGGGWGFPSQLADDKILDLVLSQVDEFPNGEERRLFYVAATRARLKTFIVAETGAGISSFTSELLGDQSYRISVVGENLAKLQCKVCGSGTMLPRDGSTGRFYGCSNYPLCAHTEQTCPNCHEGLLVLRQGNQATCHRCGHQADICPKCKTGVLLSKHGKFGPFLGCSNFSIPEINCGYTKSQVH